MEVLLNTYEQVKKDRPEITPWSGWTGNPDKRICAIYVNVGGVSTTLLNDKDNSYKALVTEKNRFSPYLTEENNTELENSLKKKITLAKELAEKDKIQEEKINLELRQQKDICSLQK